MVDTEGEGPSEPLMLNEIELVFKPHPTEMAGDNSLIKALKENSIRYIKTTANATGEISFQSCLKNKTINPNLCNPKVCCFRFFFSIFFCLKI